MRITFAAWVLATMLIAGPALAVKQGDIAPQWQAMSFADERVSFPALAEGKPTVLVFWATWCGYCKAFMPYLKEIQAEYGADRVVVVAVNAKEKDGDPDAYVASLGFPLTAIRDGDAIAADYNVKFIPGLMVVDGDGTVAWRRGWTDLPAGKTVAQQWAGEVKAALARLL